MRRLTVQRVLRRGQGGECAPILRVRSLSRATLWFPTRTPSRSIFAKPGRGSLSFSCTAAGEMIRFLDALGIDRSILWGHSDGATIAAWMAIDAPERFGGVILEALHFYRCKPLSSAEMLVQLAENPDRIGERVSSVLAAEHGEDHWRDLIVANSRAWLEIAATSPHPKADVFDGRLAELRPPTLLIHGSRDPRTEPDELDSIRRSCPQGQMHIIGGGAHSPHTETASFEECNRVASEFLLQIGVPNAAAGRRRTGAAVAPVSVGRVPNNQSPKCPGPVGQMPRSI